MRVSDHYDHLAASLAIAKKNELGDEIYTVLNDPHLRFGRNHPSEIKAVIARRFNECGWADRVRVSYDGNLTVNFVKQKVGICLQLGNVARTYADILKLALLGHNGVIEVGVIAVPDEAESKMLGQNYAHFDRLAKEMQLFGPIIQMPLLVLALAN